MADATSSAGNATARPRHWPFVLCCVLLLTHFGLATRNGSAGFLAGHEFRQTQTALSILFIERDHDYSLAYPTPLFGPPWSVPMEFPLYQWTVAGLQTATGWSLPIAGRTLTLACFYLTLPAVFWLLGEFGFARPVRWLTLCFTLAAPVYLFFSRAILIESMALMFSVWFLAAFARLCRTPHVAWLLLATLAGTAATLVKVTTFMPWCAGAAVIGLRWSWREWRQQGWRAWRATLAWGAASAALPGLATVWWVHRADEIKSTSPGGQALASGELSDVNFGTWHDRVGAESLQALLRHGDRAIGPWWLLLLVFATAWFLGSSRRERRVAWLPLLWFFGTLATFPVLYHRHDYYFYAIAVLPLAALSIVLAPAITASRRRRLAPLLTIAVLAGQLSGYARDYAGLQQVKSNGGTPLTHALRDMLPPDGVMIIAGQDWYPVMPYYTERRALMLRENVSSTPAERDRYFDALDGSPVAALILTDAERSNRALIEAATARYQLDPRVTLSDADNDVYLSLALRNNVLGRLHDHPDYIGVETRGELPPPPAPEPLVADEQPHAVSAAQASQLFGLIHPAPREYQCKFGFDIGHFDGARILGAHPESDLWLPFPAGAKHITLRFGMQPGSYANPADGTDGVTFSLTAISADGTATEFWSRHLDPVHNDSDRALQAVTVDLPATARTIRCSTRCGTTYNFDWAFWAGIEIE